MRSPYDISYKQDMKTRFLNRYFEPSIEDTLRERQAVPLKTVKSSYYILAVDIIGYLAAYLMIRSYMGNSIKRMLWFVVLPIFFDCLALLLFHIWFKGSQNREESYYRSTTYIVGGVLIYSFMYCDCVLVYHDISEILIFLLIPAVIACFYVDMRWYVFQVVMEAVFFCAFVLLRKAELPIHLTQIPPMLRILFFMLGIFHFSNALIGQDRMKIRMLRESRELSAREELQRTLTEKLNRECSAHINTIKGAALDIMEEENNTDIQKYAGYILDADDLLMKTITDADLKRSGGDLL